MAYSTIQQKKLICKDCNDGIEKPVIAGRCHYHYKLYRSKISLEKRKISSLKNDPENLNIKKQSEWLNQWYLDRRKEMIGFCKNCGKRSCKTNDKFWKWSIAHILPKNNFKSISLNKSNWIELCIDCHTLYDRDWETASKMFVWEYIIKKYNLFKDQIAEEEKRRIPNQFLL